MKFVHADRSNALSFSFLQPHLSTTHPVPHLTVYYWQEETQEASINTSKSPGVDSPLAAGGAVKADGQT